MTRLSLSYTKLANGTEPIALGAYRIAIINFEEKKMLCSTCILLLIDSVSEFTSAYCYEFVWKNRTREKYTRAVK